MFPLIDTLYIVPYTYIVARYVRFHVEANKTQDLWERKPSAF